MRHRIRSGGPLQPRHVLALKVRVLASQVIPMLIELIRCSSRPSFGNFPRPRTQQLCDPWPCVVAFQLTRNATAEVENPVFHEDEPG